MTGEVPPCGVLRHEISGPDEPPTVTGSLWAQVPPEGVVLSEPLVVYTLDRGRLVGMLEAARSGVADDMILLALDAAALGEPPPDWSPDA